MKLFGKDWVKRSEDLKKELDKVQKKLNFAPYIHRKALVEELARVKSQYEEALGKALEQKAAEREKARRDKKKKK